MDAHETVTYEVDGPIAVIALAFQFDYTVSATVLGAMFVGVAGLVAITHFCIPSVVFHFLFGDRSLIVPAWTGEARV